MKCPICKHGETRHGVVNVSLERGGAVFIVKHVPAEICDNCGEEYIAANVTEAVLNQAGQAAGNGVQVDVREYLAA